MTTPPPRGSDPDEQQAAQLMAQSIAGLGCEQSGEALRRLSNLLLSGANFATKPNPFPPGPRAEAREAMRRKWQAHFRSAAFWRKTWDRLAESFSQCDQGCFGDGEAVGMISGIGYCSASIGVGGLTAPGFAYQPPMPLCQNAIFVGCQRGYQTAATTYDGCSTYTTGEFEAIFREYQSQDCLMDTGF